MERRNGRKCAQGKNRTGENAAHRKKAKQEKLCVHRGKTGENVSYMHAGDTDRKTTVIFTELPVRAVLLM